MNCCEFSKMHKAVVVVVVVVVVVEERRSRMLCRVF
jgi:hypothetical protein